MMGLLSLAKPDFDAIKQFRGDEDFATCLGLNGVPSEGTLRQRLDEIGLTIRTAVLKRSASLVRDYAPQLGMSMDLWVPIDADVSPFDNSGTKKEGVSCTYKKVDGYAPMLAYIASGPRDICSMPSCVREISIVKKGRRSFLRKR
jgi:hypothetical protein